MTDHKHKQNMTINWNIKNKQKYLLKKMPAAGGKNNWLFKIICA